MLDDYHFLFVNQAAATTVTQYLKIIPHDGGSVLGARLNIFDDFGLQFFFRGIEELEGLLAAIQRQD